MNRRSSGRPGQLRVDGDLGGHAVQIGAERKGTPPTLVNILTTTVADCPAAKLGMFHSWTEPGHGKYLPAEGVAPQLTTLLGTVTTGVVVAVGKIVGGTVEPMVVGARLCEISSEFPLLRQ